MLKRPMVKMMKMYVRICVFPLHMCAFVHMSRRYLCVVGKIPVGTSEVPRNITLGIRKLCDSMKIRKDSSTLAYWNIFFTCFLSVLFFFFFKRELFIPLTQCPVSQFSFFSFNFKADEKNNEGEEQEVRDDNHPKGREEHYEEEDDEEEDGAAAAEKSRRRAEM